MYCPFCGHVETKVTDSRLAGEGRQIRRRRECLKCGERFTTFEAAELLMPMVIKGDRGREAFDEAKLRAGMEKALQKRPVPRAEDVEAFHEEIQRLRSARPPAGAAAQPRARKRATARAADRDQLPLLPAEPAANDATSGPGGKK